MKQVYLVRGSDGKMRMETDPAEPENIIDVTPVAAPRSRGSFKWKFYGIASLTVFIIGWMSISSAIAAYNSPERVAYRAALARQDAMQDACQRITEKVTACYTGDKEECKSLQESNAWFVSEKGFGEYPEFACPNAYDPLVLGAR